MWLGSLGLDYLVNLIIICGDINGKCTQGMPGFLLIINALVYD